MSAAGPRVFELRLRVRYAETDGMRIVHHANYPVYFEEARSELSREAGLPYAMMEAEGYAMAVAEINIRYLRPAIYDQELVVRTTVQKVGSRGVTFGYDVLLADTDVLIATGSSKHVLVDQSGNPTRFPPAWLEQLRALSA
ncbi:MAG: acyl-CoA thioesterase [Chloroflexi bacterium]|nr:acyl-CoA thioesterase [Chloroflexota bacterium]